MHYDFHAATVDCSDGSEVLLDILSKFSVTSAFIGSALGWQALQTVASTCGQKGHCRGGI